MRFTRGIALITVSLLIDAADLRAGEQASWQTTARVRDAKTHVVPAFWAQMPHLKAKSKIKVLDVDGPGVVSLIHLTSLTYNLSEGFSSPEAQRVMIRVFYDRGSAPAIEMPCMDFFGDIQCQSAHFSTRYFSKTRESHNFRLPMPFRTHITIEIENPSDKGLWAYMDVQWEQVAEIPAECGYLYTDYRAGNILSKQPNVMCEIGRPGSIVAHWLQYESEKSPKGEVICEADQEIYLDGDAKPTLDYLGSEDLYGHSWGFRGISSDTYAAIIKQEDLNPGSRIAVLRCRENDAISFRHACKWILSFVKGDQGAINILQDSPVPFRHCVYYYAK